MHTDVIRTNKRRAHTQSNYTNTKLKAWFRRLLRHPARKRSGSILNWHTCGHTQTPLSLTMLVWSVYKPDLFSQSSSLFGLTWPADIFWLDLFCWPTSAGLALPFCLSNALNGNWLTPSF